MDGKRGNLSIFLGIDKKKLAHYISLTAGQCGEKYLEGTNSKEAE